MIHTENPLVSNFNTPFETVPFERIKPGHFRKAFKIKLKQTKQRIKAIVENTDTPSFQNTLLPLEEAVYEVSRIGLILFNLNSAATNKSIQQVSQDISPKLTKLMSRIMLNSKLYNKIDTIFNSDEKRKLTPEEQWLLECTWHSMKRNGANLSFLSKLRLVSIQMKLSKLTLKFNDNVLAETNKYKLHITNPADLDGLHQSEIDMAALAAKENKLTGWVFTLHYPSFAPFMKYAANRQLREKMYMAYMSRGNKNNSYNNRRYIKRISKLRLKLAKTTGFSNYAQYVLDERMAKTPETVIDFLEQLHNASRPFAINDFAEVKNKARETGFNEELMPWDFQYYSQKLKSDKYGFDENMVKPYFSLENVIDAIFNLSGKLYGISFKKSDKIEVYHPDVNTYEVYDNKGEFIAVLYADFFPRADKQSGAWMTEYAQQSNMNGNMKRPHISICCNFSKPGENTPSLLTFSEVLTFLHEFGHALHGMLANTVYPSISGTNVFRDFVELPSQILENWLYEIEWLRQFAKHYQTGKAIPEELVNKLVETRNFQSGYQSERQLTFAFLDMAWHTITSPLISEIDIFERETIAKTSLMPMTGGTSISTSFSHIFGGGYAAGYYSYKWAEVLDADAFSVFKTNGIFDTETAKRFRAEILEKGGSAHPMELYLNFRGKEPDIEALLERSGLKTSILQPTH